MTTPLFSVIIVNFNGGDFIQGALDSLKTQTHQSFEVILLDNASKDGSIDALDTDGLPDFTLLAEDDNHGFAKGNNIAAKQASGDWLVLLNPDAAAEPDWLEEIRQAIGAHPGTNVFASCQISMDDPSRLDGVGDNYMAFGFPWRGGFGAMTDQIPPKGLVFGPCGASAIYRRDVFEAHGGFDERLFCYCEDVDLAFRLTLAGERCIFLPSARVHHAGSAITGEQSDFTLYHSYRNRIWVYGKNMPWPLLILTLPGHILLHVYLLLRAGMTGRFAISLRGAWEGVSGLLGYRKPSVWSAPKRKRSLFGVARAMAWNPWKLSGHDVFVKPIKDRPAR